MLNLFENFRNVVQDGKTHSPVDSNLNTKKRDENENEDSVENVSGSSPSVKEPNDPRHTSRIVDKNLKEESSADERVCNTCDYEDAPVTCASCCHAFCRRCGSTPTTSDQWRCFLCELELTKRCIKNRIWRLKSGVRSHLEKDPRSPGYHDIVGEHVSETTEATHHRSTSQPAAPATPKLPTSKTTTNMGHPAAKLECFARMSNAKSIEIQFRQSSSLVAANSIAFTNANGASAPGDCDVDFEMEANAEDPSVFDADASEVAAPEPDHMDLDESEYLPEHEDSSEVLQSKLKAAANEIRRLKIVRQRRDQKIYRLERQLNRCSSDLALAKQTIATIAERGVHLTRGRTDSRPVAPYPPKSGYTKASPLPWSEEEIKLLKKAVSDIGPGQWKNIYDKYKDQFHPLRTKYHIRDKYKQLKMKNLW